MSDFWTVTVPSWATSIGTIGLAYIAWRSMRREQAENKKLQDQLDVEREKSTALARAAAEKAAIAARRAQAEQVVAWSDLVDVNEPGELNVDAARIAFGMQRIGTVAAAVVKNGSSRPISDVQISWGYPGADATGTFNGVGVMPLVWLCQLE